MRRADRLFEIIQHLRRKKLVRARDLAERLEVSERTIYRDVQDLMSTGVPIEGEAGVGYVMRSGFDLPPLMFNELEIEALVLGARMAAARTDPKLADAAETALSKIEAVLPDRLRRHMAETALLAPPRDLTPHVAEHLAVLRTAVRERHLAAMRYKDASEQLTERAVRPLALFFLGPAWLLAAWCELRQDFRSFRLDRIAFLGIDPERRFRPERGKSLHDYLRVQDEEARNAPAC
jgi:predicted DNA-binding transcriptional regulator YafY